MIKDQLITEDYAIYNADSMEVLPQIPDNSVGLSVYSPPFAGLYQYSSDERDFSNCESKEQFLQQYEYMIKEIARVTQPGRITAVHVTDVHDNACYLWDLPAEVIKLHAKYGFHYRCRVGIRKEPLKVRMRTMVKSLMHKLVVEDMSQCFPAMPDYLLIFTKKGDRMAFIKLGDYTGSIEAVVVSNIYVFDTVFKNDIMRYRAPSDPPSRIVERSSPSVATAHRTGYVHDWSP